MNTDDLRKTADRHLQEGQLPEALNAYAQLCEMEPGNAGAWHMQAAVNGMLGQFESTVYCCKKALEIQPDAAVVYTNYANALVELKRYKEAAQAFQHAIRLNPEDVDSLNKLGSLHSAADNLPEAESCFRKVIGMSPGVISATSNLAHILKETGRLTESIKVCENTLSTAPIDRTILTTLLECYFLVGDTGKAHQCIVSAKPLLENLTTPLHSICWRMHNQKHYAESISAIQTILKIFPDEDRLKLILADCQIQQDEFQDAIETLETLNKSMSCEGHLLLAQAYNKTNLREKAEAQLQTAVDSYPDEETPVALLARSLIESGNYDEAHAHLETFLERHPDSYRILAELGNTHELLGNNTLAENAYKQAIAIQPEYAIAHSRLGVLYQNTQRYSSARECFEAAIRHDPGMLTARCSLAYMYCTRGEYSKAQDCYDQVLEKDPDFKVAITGKAIVLERLGEVHASFELVEPLVQRGADDIHTLLAFAHACSIADKESTAARLLESALQRPGILPNDRMHACFMLGKLLDRLERYDDAFLAYQRGNELNTFSFDRGAHQRLTDAVCTVFSARNMEVFPRSSNQTDAPVFIVGMPRSGTTLTEQILSSHPEVFGAGELSHILNIATTIPESLDSQQPYPLYMRKINREVLDQFSFEHVQALQSLANGQRFITDKMPSNFMFLGLIELLFPNARILHCVRDPIDTCLSCYFQNFSKGQYFSYKQSDLAFYYKQYQRLMAHWKSTLSIPIMDIQYEQLIGDQENVSRKMIEFIGLDWLADCLDFHKSERKVRTASYGQVRKPLYSSSVKRWKNYEHHLGELRDELAT